MIHNAKERTYKCTSIFAYKKLYRNSVNTQKRQFENGISESIFCVYACVGKRFCSKIFTSYSVNTKVSLSSFKQSIQNLDPSQ